MSAIIKVSKIKDIYLENSYTNEEISDVIMEMDNTGRDFTKDEITEDEIYEERVSQERMDLDDVCSQLKAIVSKGQWVIGYGNIGTWRGREEAYWITESKNIWSFFTGAESINIRDENGDFAVEGYHHDGVNYIKARIVKDTVPYMYSKNFPMHERENHENMEKIWNKYSKKINYAKIILG